MQGHIVSAIGIVPCSSLVMFVRIIERVKLNAPDDELRRMVHSPVSRPEHPA